MMYKYTFHWDGGKTEIGYGNSAAEAFMKLGYGGGALRALDWYDEELVEEKTCLE